MEKINAILKTFQLIIFYSVIIKFFGGVPNITYNKNLIICYLTADDGEVFKVKKSSRSKKLMKQLDHERRKKKGEEKMQMDSEQPHMSVKVEKELEIKTDDLVVSYFYDVYYY